MGLIVGNGAVAEGSEPNYDIVSKHEVTLDPKDHLLYIENVVKVYPSKDGPKTVLDNVDLRVSPGEFISLVGPSGCGKSTLLRLILGSEDPTGGKMRLDGEPIGFPDPTRGIVDQKYALFPHLTVLENTLLPHRLKLPFLEWRRRKRELIAQAEHYLETAQLIDHKDKFPKQLSGGQQQRAAVMQALMNDPKILLMDEPFGALDPGSRERMQVFLLKIWEETKKTIFFVTHDLEEAVFLATRVVVLSQYYTDDRKGMTTRGARIKYEVKTGTIGRAQPTSWKLTKEFSATIERIRDEGFKPDHLTHVKDFDLQHPDSFHTVTPEEVNGINK